MKMFEVEEIKEFMKQLFLSEAFDKFCVAQVEIKTFVSFEIKGNLLTDWLSEEEKEIYGAYTYVPWKLLRETAFSLIRGKQTPEVMRIQFVHYKENGDCGGIRIQYEKGELYYISSYTTAQFSLDKSEEIMWDEHCEKFLRGMGINIIEK